MYVIGIDPGISGAICFFDEGKIIDVIEKGYFLNDKVIRYAKVVVANNE